MDRDTFWAWSNEGLHLLISFYPEDIENSHFYYMPWSELKTANGSRHWFSHLSEKTWFTPKAEIEMSRLIRERMESHE